MQNYSIEQIMMKILSLESTIIDKILFSYASKKIIYELYLSDRLIFINHKIVNIMTRFLITRKKV